MTYLIVILLVSSLISIVNGQQCSAGFNQSITGQCSSAHNCSGTLLTSTVCGKQLCCIPTRTLPVSPNCLSANQFYALYNSTPRAQTLLSMFNYGLNAAGICNHCQAKAAFLAIAATMTKNFSIDERSASDAQFTADDDKYGNKEKGDGSRFRRRGLFGLRGRTMYERLQTVLPQYQSVNNSESVALLENAIIIAARLWNYPDLMNKSSLTRDADESFYGFSMLWHKLSRDMTELATGVKYYQTFLRHLQCGSDLYQGEGPSCIYNKTHLGTCTPKCIKGLEESSSFCGCSNPKAQPCPNSPSHVRCYLDSCAQELKLDLGLVLDASGSIGKDNYTLQLNFTRGLLRQLNVGQNKTHVGIINYSTDREVLTWLNQNYALSEKLSQVDRATYYGIGTDTASALKTTDTVFSTGNGRRKLEQGVTAVIFVLTDGASDNSSTTIQAAKILKDKDITLVSVGVGGQVNLAELHAICSSPAAENYFAMSDYQALQSRIDQFKSKTCSEPGVISSNTTVTDEIQKDKYKFLKIKIILMSNKTLIKVTLFNGNVKLFYSFTNRNPKDPADFFDYESETRSIIEATPKKSSEVTLVIDKPDAPTGEYTFIGVKGLEDNTRYQIQFDDCAKVDCTKSSAITIKFSILLTILCTLFVF
ncbi:unnamed protein product [Adineta ricciae]|uniref:VWFA domain-containing protein n=1 Tax=Adineta ricciae TaxID=249248 RepID=A0A814Y3S5_ADIRI|nr:unnamed protein product [Adineta ricciae]CAF1257337.1 unnamed protein product [Adineta ricciae]